MRVTQLSDFGALHTSRDLSVGKELGRLLTAAVVSREFCNLLLADPATAVETGYNGEVFDLAVEEQEFIFSIRAATLADFARQLTSNSNGNGHNGNGHGHREYNNREFKGKLCGLE